MARAAEGLKKITLELGGSDPCIVLDDADIEGAAKAISIGRFFNCGQACLAVKRLYVQEGVYDALMEKLVARAAKLKPGNGWRRKAADGSDAHGDAAGRGRGPGQGRGRARRPGFFTAAAGRKARSTTRAGSSSRRSWRTCRTARGCGPRRSSARRCRSAASRTSTRAFGWPTTPQYGLGSSIWTTNMAAAHRGRPGDRGRLHLGQRLADRARRAALRRHQAVGLRQGARRRGLPTVHRAEVGRLRRCLTNPARVTGRRRGLA